ncbi:MAG: HAMP domain-containing protein [Gammaproteobacteria bacterium]|nr:HAMP domain-containing protein [Rhodocyclaceae bacterium]MBU3908453.1 HAMP domain-containing protein [Gammaproteobacteria bacterium]MBU3990282.1 HAMP domain-containing protein [Gammaproteobacteria bacterium]MBU4005399.1 HAMP domain-containing protein [Gammaproteobacteria bacterium]MBU4021084.1 HAMP domain-containing protein [Gammaproteobacteria bacterium]
MLLAVAAWLTIFREAELEPRARQLTQLVVSMTNLTRVALLAAQPELRHHLLAELSDREGLHVYPADDNDQIVPPPPLPLPRRIATLLQERLGADTRLAFELNGEPGLFVSFRIFEGTEGDFWLALPRERLERKLPLQWLGWGAAVLLLSLAGAWLIVFLITRPLRALETAARKVGAGETPPPLPEHGPQEITAVTAAFNQMSANLRQLEDDRRLLLAGISHDLRTPLTRLRMETELSVAEPEARAGMAADIEEMDRTIGQFLDFARPQDSAGTPAEPTDLDALLNDIAGRYGDRVRRPASADFSKLAAARPEALRRAIINLIENALRHAGTAEPVDLTLTQAGNEIVIAIEDRGPGIASGEIERLKLPFTRGETARTGASGAGLGLAIVERIVRAQHGRLELLPRDGGGLSAQIRLRCS